MNWQPIETAPKDGQTILVWAKDSYWGFAAASWYEDGGSAWWHIDDGKHGPYPLRGPSPTHWCELTPPEREKAPPAGAGEAKIGACAPAN